MKKILFTVLGLSLLFATVANAQDTTKARKDFKGKREFAKKRIEEKKANMTEDEKAKWEAKKKEMKEKRENMTPEQKEEAKKKALEMKKKREEKRALKDSAIKKH